MIKFFRKIRQKLLTENKLRKYLLYAVGEIVLVVIGILIALAINNWNEDRKTDVELKQISQNLIQEFESNQVALNRSLGDLKSAKNAGLEILSLMNPPKSKLETIDVDSLIEMSLFFPNWKPTSFVLNELKSAGKLKSLKNNRLKELLFKYERLAENIIGWNNHMKTSSQSIIDYMKDNASLRNINHNRFSIKKSNFEYSNMSLLSDLKFENRIDEKLLYSLFAENSYNAANKLI